MPRFTQGREKVDSFQDLLTKQKDSLKVLQETINNARDFKTKYPFCGKKTGCCETWRLPFLNNQLLLNLTVIREPNGKGEQASR
jgi:hypothetical protein